MSMIKRITLTINKNNNGVKLSSPLNFYKNDSLTLYFEIEKFNFDIKQYTRIIPISAIAYVETPDGTDSLQATIVDGQLIMFRLTPFHTQHVGVSKLQLVIRDNDGCQCATPYFTFSISDVINEYEVLVDDDGNIITSEEDIPLIHEGENGYNSISDLEETYTLKDAYMLVTRDKKSYKAKTSLLSGNTNPNPSQPDNPSDSTIDMSEYAKKDDIPTLVSQLENDMGYLTEHQDVSHLALKSDLEDLASKNYVDESINNINIDTTNLVTKNEFNNELSNKSDIDHNHDNTYSPISHEHSQYLTEHQDLSAYALKTEIPTVPTKLSELQNDGGFISEIPSEYINETELNNALATKANSSDIPSLEGYATESFVKTKIAEASLGGGEIDLSEYAKTEDIKKIIPMRVVNVLDLGIVPNVNSSDIRASNASILKASIDENYKDNICYYFPINKYYFDLIEITDTTKTYNIVLAGETNYTRKNISVNEDKRPTIYTNGTDGFINRTNTSGANQISFYISHLSFKQGDLYSFKPLGMCFGTTKNLQTEYNFFVDDVTFHGYEYCLYSPGWSCAGTKITRTSFSHSKYGLYITSASHRLYMDDIDLGYCKYGIRLGVGGNPCTIKNVHVAVGCFDGMNEYLAENPLMYAIHTKGGLVIDGMYYEQYSGELDVTNYCLIHHEAFARGNVGKLIVKNAPIGNMGAGNKGYYYYGRKYIGEGLECKTEGIIRVSNGMTETEFPNGCANFENCLTSNTYKISELIAKTFNLNDDGSLYSVGYTIDGREICNNGVFLSKHYRRKFNSAMSDNISLATKKPNAETLLLHYDTVFLNRDDGFVIDGISYSANPTRDNSENSYGVYYKGTITINGLTNQNTNVILGIVGINPTDNTQSLIREFIKIDSSLINKKVIIDVDEYIPKSEAINVFFGYKCVNNVDEYIIAVDSKKIIYDMECIYDSSEIPYNIPISNSSIRTTEMYSFLVHNHDEYITEDELNGKGYVTESELNSKGYATTSQIPTTLPANGGNANTINGYSIWVGTQEEYNALKVKSDTVIYFIKG